MNFKPFILCLAIIGLAGCTMVKPTEQSDEITLVKAFNVKDCAKLGTTNVSIEQKTGIFSLDDKTATKDLITLAKNRAGAMGGDSIVAKGPIEEGKMTFDIYKCGQ
jgi:predicted dinucleotide-binding enzyme